MGWQRIFDDFYAIDFLNQAAEIGQNETVRTLIDRGADVDSTDTEGKTALDIATDEVLFQANPFKLDKTGHQRVVELLTKKKT